MEEIDIALVTKRSIKGIFALTSRTFVVQLVSFASNLLLTIFLSPSVFGVYFVVSAAIAFLSYFSDIGLAAALIQKKEEITEEELRTTFTIQQILVGTVVILALVLSPFIAKFYNLKSEEILLYQALAISFFLSSLKTIPSIILERGLHFEKLVVPQIVEVFFFSVTAVVFAMSGFGVTSFTLAVLARGISGLIAIYVIQPWHIRFGFSKASARRLLSFGIPFQTNSFLGLIKDDLFIAYLGKALPIAQVGYIGFAQKWAYMPLRLIMDNVIRITFPSFSRLQHEKDVLTKALEKAMFASCYIIFPAVTGLVIMSPYFIHFIPKYQKWEPALFSLFLFSINACLSSVSTPLTNALNAIGKIKVSLYLMVFWTIATWVLTPILIVMYGFNGVAIASALISLSVVGVVIITKRYINFSIIFTTAVPVISTIIMGVIVYLLSGIFVKGMISLLAMCLVGVLLYFATSFIIAKEQILSDIKLVRDNLKQ
jgi:O-antigen/teichoic acid export membrane protein